MAAEDFRRTRLRRFAQLDDRETPEARYWKKFKYPVVHKHSGAINWLSFSPVEPHDFVATTGPHVVVYDSKSNKERRAINRFKDVAYSASYRADGRLIVAGGEIPDLQIFDVETKSRLRVLKGHKRAVHVTRFGSDNVHVFSGSDDRTVRFWDMTTEKCVSTMLGHSDHVRAGCINPTSPSLWCSGSYDHTVKLWDCRTKLSPAADEDGESKASSSHGAVMTMNHEAPVEAALILPGGSTLVTAGGNSLKAWDLLSGGKLVHTWSHHQKTITSLCLDGTNTRLLSGGLDCHVQIYDLNTFALSYGLRYAAPVTSLACAPDNSRLVVGLADGELSVRQRIVKMEDSLAEARRAEVLAGGSYRFFLRGKTARPSTDDLTVTLSKKPRLQAYDVFMKKFQYQNALDAALDTHNPIVVVSVLEELIQRDGLRIALGGRDDKALEPMLLFLVRYITHPRFSSVLTDVASVVFDMYVPVLGQSVIVDDLFVRLQTRVAGELRLEKELLSVLGTLDLVMACSATGAATPATGAAPLIEDETA